MRKIRDVLRLKLEARLSHERIAASLGISKGVVAKYVSLAAVAGLDWATIQPLSDTDLERRVVQGRLDRPTHYVLPDYERGARASAWLPAVWSRVCSRSGATLSTDTEYVSGCCRWHAATAASGWRLPA